MRKKLILFLLFIINMVLLSCSNGKNPLDAAVNKSLMEPRCVYNQAYQETYREDSINTILKDARGCYVLVDPFSENTIPEQIPEIKDGGNSVGCYISIGTGEDWRDDFSAMRPFLVEKQWGEWAGEYFVNETATGIVSIMKERIDQMADWGCDWVEFDNMDWAFDEKNRQHYQIQATSDDGEKYFQELCDYTHEQGMLCMAKSTRTGAEKFDGITIESIYNDKNWWEDETLQGFLDEGKLTIIVHYKEPDCEKVYDEYLLHYDDGLSFICEDRKMREYMHFNE